MYADIRTRKGRGKVRERAYSSIFTPPFKGGGGAMSRVFARGNGRDAKEASGHEIRQAHGMESISLKQRLKMNIILSVAMQWV